MKILLILPAYNEQENILQTVNKIKEYSNELDYIVINDGSTDNTEQILAQNNINHIKLVNNLGIGGAVQTGYKYALENSRVYIDISIVDGTNVVIEMKNISKDKLNISADELMQRFVRGDRSRNTEGSGLGISIAQNLTELQNGTFELKLDGDLFKVKLTFYII